MDDQKILNTLSKGILDAGKAETERWIGMVEKEFETFKKLEKQSRLVSLDRTFASRYHSFFSSSDGRLIEPNFEREELLALGSHQIPLHDTNGIPIPRKEIIAARFVHIVLFREWVNDQVENLNAIPKAKVVAEIENPQKQFTPWGFTGSQTVLMYYFGMKGLGLEAMDADDLSNYTRFLLLMLGRDAKSKMASNDFYQKLRTAPNFKGDKALIRDLETIKPYFERIGFFAAAMEIDKEIETAKREKRRIKTEMVKKA